MILNSPHITYAWSWEDILSWHLIIST
jgi:hypothetical protein